MLWGHARVVQWGRKDGFPGADGSTITQTGNPNATTSPIYNADGLILEEGSTRGLQLISINNEGILITNTSFIYAIKHPLVFIYGNTPLYDWYTTDALYQNASLWNKSNQKSDYDPCPLGWRVPSDGIWNDFPIQSQGYGSGNKAINGLVYNHIAWYPAIGYRHFKTGALSYIGAFGFYWMSSTNNTQSGYVYFEMGNVYAHNTNGSRAHGFAVRCVQE